MEEYTQITLDEWTQWKEDIRKKLAETAENFVYIGYRLKQIRDSGMFDGAADIFEFARNEYGLGKSTVSRFIAINEKYSEGGNSLELREEYRNFSSSKLSEMLTLPDSECQLITKKTTIKEIRALKEFDRQQVTEEAAVGEKTQRTPIQKCIIEFFAERKEMLNGIMKLLDAEVPDYKKAAELMNPSGQSSFKKGIAFVFLYDWNMGVKCKLLTEPQPISYSWSDFLEMVFDIYKAEDLEDVWKSFYGADAEIQNEPQKEHEKQETEKTVQPQLNQGFETSVATSQQQDKNGQNGDSQEEEKDGRKDAAQVCNEEPEKTEDHISDVKAEDGEPAHWGNGSNSGKEETLSKENETDKESNRRWDIWVDIEEASRSVTEFADSYYPNNAADREIPFTELKEAYHKAVDLAAGLELLMADYEAYEATE